MTDLADDTQLIALNPWWINPGLIENDAHLKNFRSGPFLWTPPVLADIELSPGAVHTLRGPRQVGKTTTAKRLIETLIQRGERRIIYYSFDLERENNAIPAVIRRAKELAGQDAGPWYLFLDEVTVIPDWQLGIKFAWDHGLIREDFVLCTGSSAHRMGMEQLPGRRGTGKNFLQLTVSFRDFCTAVRKIELPPTQLSLAEWLTPRGHALAKRLYLQLPELRDALDIYLNIGGFPAALRDYMTAGEVSMSTINSTWAMIANEIRLARLDATSALKLIERIGISLGSPLSWQTAADAMDVASHNTARAYVHTLAESFTLLIVYHWAIGGGFEPRKQRKVYFVDPLFGQVPSAALGIPNRTTTDAILEGAIATGLFRSASDHITQSDPTIGSLGYWRSSDGREIDFITHTGDLTGERTLPVEVKGDSQSGINAAASSLRRTFQRGIIATRSQLNIQDDILVIPAAILLAGLTERTERRLSTL